MAHGKELVCLCKSFVTPGVESAVLTDAKEFREADISEVFIDDPWFGVIDLTVDTYVAATYNAYTALAPPAAGHIMFDADRSHFITGNWIWFGKLMALVIPVGSRVLTS